MARSWSRCASETAVASCWGRTPWAPAPPVDDVTGAEIVVDGGATARCYAYPALDIDSSQPSSSARA